MTKDEAIKVLDNEIRCVDTDCDIERSCGKCPYSMPSKEPIIEAYRLAIKALKQYGALQEIRQEIDSHCSDNRDRNDGLYIAMKIIDKYMAESENKNETT